MNVLHTINIAFTLFILAVAAYVVVTVFLQYRKATGTTAQRLFVAAKESQTILWNQFCIIVAAAVAQLDTVVGFFTSDPAYTNFINTWFTAKTVSAIMLVMATLTIYFRMRPGSKDPVK